MSATIFWIAADLSATESCVLACSCPNAICNADCLSCNVRLVLDCNCATHLEVSDWSVAMSLAEVSCIDNLLRSFDAVAACDIAAFCCPTLNWLVAVLIWAFARLAWFAAAAAAAACWFCAAVVPDDACQNVAASAVAIGKALSYRAFC